MSLRLTDSPQPTNVVPLRLARETIEAVGGQPSRPRQFGEPVAVAVLRHQLPALTLSPRATGKTWIGLPSAACSRRPGLVTALRPQEASAVKEACYRYFRLGRLPCGVCDQPALCSEICPSGIVRTFHVDRERPPCDSLRPSMPSEQSKHGATAVRKRPPGLASSRPSTVKTRRAA
jgi:hypothetical protein